MSDLGTLGGLSSSALGINSSGTIVGWAYTAAGAQHSFSWLGGTITDLGTLGGTTSYASGINTAGWIVGTSSTTGGQTDAFVISGGSMLDLNSITTGLPGGVTLTNATSINNLNQILATGSDYGSYLLSRAQNLNLYVSQGNYIKAVNSQAAVAVDSIASDYTETGGMAFDAQGNVYFASGDPSSGIGSVYMIAPGGAVTTYATGLGVLPSGLAFDSHGNLFVSNNANGSNGVIYKVTPSGTVSTFATGLPYAYSMAIDSSDNLFVCNLYTSTAISKITPSGSVSTFAYVGLGAAGLGFDSGGNLVVASPGGSLYKFTPAGVESTIT
jgi:probable HAF family extracellular repeat protein